MLASPVCIPLPLEGEGSVAKGRGHGDTQVVPTWKHPWPNRAFETAGGLYAHPPHLVVPAWFPPRHPHMGLL